MPFCQWFGHESCVTMRKYRPCQFCSPRTDMFRTPWIIAALLASSVFAAADKPVERDADWIDQRVKEWQPRAEEKRFDEIGWAADIRAAEKLAKENNRPVFLFTHDGRMN